MGVPFIIEGGAGFDPAQSATIFATTVTDVVGFFVLLGLAWMFMSKMTGARALTTLLHRLGRLLGNLAHVDFVGRRP